VPGLEHKFFTANLKNRVQALKRAEKYPVKSHLFRHFKSNSLILTSSKPQFLGGF
jgi:hypothetical protein